MADHSKELRELFRAALSDRAVLSAAAAIKKDGKASTLAQTIELARALSEACGAKETARVLRAELIGYAEAEVEIPQERKALGFASPFPVRALDLGLLDPEEIFLANREKFSQVTLTIGQPIDELITALAQIRQGGVLALRVPASEVTGDSATTDEDAEVFIYILPREIQKIVDAARARALEAISRRVVEAALNEPLSSD
jgi:hypothetical protein